LQKLNYLKLIEYSLFSIFNLDYVISSCSINTKNRAKHKPGKTSVTTGVKIAGRKDAVIILLLKVF
jgi:hypothetical protein|tara:strand:+ start:6015 stop:6212 length:198 start_codon:yes stop_codon:yes gene_type:complete